MNVSEKKLLEKDYEFFEKIILDYISKYKDDPKFKYWYASVGDNCDGKLNENFISIGMFDNENKVNYSRIRIPKNEIGEQLIQKFLKSYLVEGIKTNKKVENQGENLNTIQYITTNDNRYLEIYSVNKLKKEEEIVKLNCTFENNIEEKKAELNNIIEKIDYLNEMLGIEETKSKVA